MQKQASASFNKVMSFNKGTSSSFAVQRQKSLHSGWLTKQGGWPKTMRRRWFEIKGDQLYYFKDKDDAKYLDTIPLPGNKVVRRTPQEGESKYMFEITAGNDRQGRPVTDSHDTYVLIASTQTDMDAWIRVINQVIYTPLGGGMFGRDLKATLKVDMRRGGGSVPIIIEVLVNALRISGMNEEGLFRLPGEVQLVDELKECFNTGNIPDASLKTTNVHTIASLLKLYLRELPDPIVPHDFYDEFIELSKLYKKDQVKAITGFKGSLSKLPRASFNVLKYLCRFLAELIEHSEQTKMGLHNLAVVFGPNFLSPVSEDPRLLIESTSQISHFVECLLRNHVELFPASDDEKCYSPRSPTGFDLEQRSNSSGFLACPNYDNARPNSPSSPSLLSRHSEFNNVIGEEQGQTNSNFDWQRYAMELVGDLDNQRIQFEKQMEELQSKRDAELKVRDMLKLRLYDEHKARVAAERRLEIYRIGLEEFCAKYGDVDISIRDFCDSMIGTNGCEAV